MFINYEGFSFKKSNKFIIVDSGQIILIPEKDITKWKSGEFGEDNDYTKMGEGLIKDHYFQLRNILGVSVDDGEYEIFEDQENGNILILIQEISKDVIENELTSEYLESFEYKDFNMKDGNFVIIDPCYIKDNDNETKENIEMLGHKKEGEEYKNIRLVYNDQYHGRNNNYAIIIYK